MKKLILIIFALVLTTSGYFFFFQKESNKSNKTTTKEESFIQVNDIPVEDAKIEIVTFGKRIKDDRAYFYQWEAQSKKEQERLLSNEVFFLFSVEEFKKDSNQAFIQNLIDNGKTVLFYGYQLDVPTILEDIETIPYYQILSNKSISSYLYGYGYSIPSKSMIPITVMGNFEEKDMDKNIITYLISHKEKHLTE